MRNFWLIWILTFFQFSKNSNFGFFAFSEKSAEIRQRMANFSIPDSNIPDWAKKIPEDAWKFHLMTKIAEMQNGAAPKNSEDPKSNWFFHSFLINSIRILNLSMINFGFWNLNLSEINFEFWNLNLSMIHWWFQLNFEFIRDWF